MLQPYERTKHMKKRIAALAAVCIISVSLTGAAKAWTPDDIRTLQTGLLTTGAPAVYDLDQNGVVDVFDLGLLKRAMNETGEVTAQSIPLTAENAKLQSSCRAARRQNSPFVDRMPLSR